MTRNDRKSTKIEIAILTFSCDEYESLGRAFQQAKKFSKSTILGAREIWAVKKVIFLSKDGLSLEAKEIEKVILYFFGEKHPQIDDLLTDPSLIEFLKCMNAKIFITEEKIPWPEVEEMR